MRCSARMQTSFEPYIAARILRAPQRHLEANKCEAQPHFSLYKRALNVVYDASLHTLSTATTKKMSATPPHFNNKKLCGHRPQMLHQTFRERFKISLIFRARGARGSFGVLCSARSCRREARRSARARRPPAFFSAQARLLGLGGTDSCAASALNC